MADHLVVNRVSFDAPRLRRGGGRPYSEPPRDRREFAAEQLREFDDISQRQRRRRQRLQHIDPRLVLRITVNQAVSEPTFVAALEAAGLEVVSSATARGPNAFFVGFASDEELRRFRERIDRYAEEEGATFLRAITRVDEIPPAEKIGPRLAARPVAADELAVVDIETWRLPDRELEDFFAGLSLFLRADGGRVLDRLLWTSFALVRAEVRGRQLADILDLGQVARVDRPPVSPGRVALAMTAGDFEPGAAPRPDAPAILVIDSGLASEHPLLRAAVGHEKSFLPAREDPGDDTGHGTAVAGLAGHGALEPIVAKGSFTHHVRLHSAKVLFDDGHGNPIYDDQKLLEKQVVEAVEWIVDRDPQCRVVNVSLGNSEETMWHGRRQFALATILDDLAREYDLTFVVSVGNYEFTRRDAYPQYLIDDLERTKIINPASSALALTVGAFHWIDRVDPDLAPGYPAPSPLTRVGPGLGGMVKPELLEFGGRGLIGDGEGESVLTLNQAFLQDGRLFGLSSGTSLSAPRVAHLAGRVAARYPAASGNLVRALTLVSAKLPSSFPVGFRDIDRSTHKGLRSLLFAYGYGVPTIERALESEDRRVVLVAEDEIQVDGVHLYEISVPEEFWTTAGERELDIALCFDPPVNPKRLEYFGNSLEFHLFRNTDIADLQAALAEMSEDDESGEDLGGLSADLRRKAVKLNPGVRLRSKGANQRAWRSFARPPQIDSRQFILAVLSKNRWIKERDPAFRQAYGLAVQFTHRAMANLYQVIRARNQARLRARIGIG